MKIRICLLIILMGLFYPDYISLQESPYVSRLETNNEVIALTKL